MGNMKVDGKATKFISENCPEVCETDTVTFIECFNVQKILADIQ